MTFIRFGKKSPLILLISGFVQLARNALNARTNNEVPQGETELSKITLI
jgi:hypothetical protein